MIILRKIYTEVSHEKSVTVHDVEDPRNYKKSHKRVSHDSGPGWSESSSCESYSEEKHF